MIDVMNQLPPVNIQKAMEILGGSLLKKSTMVDFPYLCKSLLEGTYRKQCMNID